MLCGVISKKDFAVNAFLIALLFGLMWVSCRDEVFYSILFVDFVLFFLFIAVHSALYRHRTQINLFLQGKTDKKSRLILQIVNRIVDIQICGRDKVFFDTVIDLQNDKNKLIEQNSQLLLENRNVNKSIIEKNAVIQHISSEKISSISHIEQSINGAQRTIISGLRTIFSNANNYKEKELKETIVGLKQEYNDLCQQINNCTKELNTLELKQQYAIQKYNILNSALYKITIDFNGIDKVSKNYTKALVKTICRDAAIQYSDSLSNEIYELLPPNLVLKGKGGKPCQAVIDATRELEKQLKS